MEKYCGPRCNFLFTTTVLAEQLKKKGKDIGLHANTWSRK